MASPGQVTPRAKRRRRDPGAPGLSAAEARAPRHDEGGWGASPAVGRRGRAQGGCVVEPAAPGEAKPATPRPERREPWAKRGERAAAPRTARDPACPPARPRRRGLYFAGLPADEERDPAVPGLLAPAASAPAPARGGPRKTRSTPEPTLVLELEGTLVCSSVLAGGRAPGAAATFTTAFQGDAYEVHLKLRPHVQQFLESLSKTYEIFVFTTAKQDYAEKVLDVLDPKRKLIRHCLSQRDCLCARGCYWKDLSLLSRDLAKTVALDHTIQGFASQAANWIPVPRWRGDPGDEELLRLIPLLGELCQAGDVRTEIQRQFPLCRLLAED